MIRRIVVDSSSNFYNLTDVEVKSVPLRIITDKKEYVDTDQLDTEEMVEDLAKYNGKTTTSCPNSSDWLEAFEGADEIFVITITSALSGSFGAAMVAREDYIMDNKDAKVYVLDSLSTGPQMRLVAEMISDMIADNATFEEIVEKIEGYNKKLRLIFSLESLHNLASNGRVSFSLATLAGVLGIRTIGKASVEGTLQSIGKAHGKKKAILTIYNEMIKEGFKGGKVRIAHCLNEFDAGELIAKIRGEYPTADILIEKCMGLCSFYAEKGGLLVGFEVQ